MNAVQVATCSRCSFWGVDKHGNCAWCEAPLDGCLVPRRSLWSRVKRLVRIGRLVARDRRVPRWLRWTILVGIMIGPLLVGPIDEFVVALLICFVVWKYPSVWREHADMVDAS